MSLEDDFIERFTEIKNKREEELKIPVTKEQAKILDSLDEVSLKDLSFQEFLRDFYPISELTFGELHSALDFGYIIKPEFKLYDWVYDKTTGSVSQIIHVSSDKNIIDLKNGISGHVTAFRHATDEEKAIEFWNSHGRELYELREDDVLVDNKYNVYLVKRVNYDGLIIGVVMSSSSPNGVYTSYVDAVTEFKNNRLWVITFAEDRLDIIQ